MSYRFVDSFRAGAYAPARKLSTNLYDRRRQPTARVPSVARGTIFKGTLREPKYSNYDLIKN